MNYLATPNLLLLISLLLFSLGLITTVTGIIILTTRATGKELRAIAAQTTRLAQKGLAENVAGLVGNASSLLEAVNQLVRTTAGIGVFLTVTGIVLMIAASLILFKLA